ARVRGHRADVACAGRPDLDQLLVSAAQQGRHPRFRRWPDPGRRRARAPAVHLRRRVLTPPGTMSGTAIGLTASALALRHGLEVRGDGDRRVTGVATLANAGPGDLAFLANPRYRNQLATTAAGVVVMRADDAGEFAGTALLARDPYSAYAKIAALFEAKPAHAPGIHPSAAIDPGATVDPSASIGPFVSVGAGSRIDAGARIGAGCVIGEDCVIGAGCELVARVTLVRRVRL